MSSRANLNFLTSKVLILKELFLGCFKDEIVPERAGDSTWPIVNAELDPGSVAKARTMTALK